MTPDGREDLSSAAAFEIGRLLALSQPSMVAALLRWRTEQFGAQRAAQIAAAALPNRFVDPVKRNADLGILVTRQLLDALGEKPLEVIGPVRPVVDPGRPLRVSEPGRELETLAEGLGVNLRMLMSSEAVAESAALVSLAESEVKVADQAEVSSRDIAARLAEALTAEVSALVNDVVAPQVMDTHRIAPIARRADALDGLLAGLQQEENQ
jgi:hypothetical protein